MRMQSNAPAAGPFPSRAAAQSPGLVKDQQSYLLGAVHNEALCGALMDMAVGPRPLEQELAEGTRSGMLLHVHGFKVCAGGGGGKQCAVLLRVEATAGKGAVDNERCCGWWGAC